MEYNGIKRDGHVHSPYCPHGSKDNFDKYIYEAIRKGIDEITFTEHMPIPFNFIEEKFLITAAPKIDEIESYFKDLTYIKHKYKEKIKINIGIEVDYIEGYEDKIKEILDKYGPFLEDSILSTHFIKIENEYFCIDLLEGFEAAVDKLGTVEAVYDEYFKSLIKSVNSDLGKYKPKRIGHPSLIRIFNKKYPLNYENKQLLDELVLALKEKDFQVDFNVAGLRKEFCKEIYPSGYLYEAIKNSNIEMIYGSDAHRADDIGSKYNI